MKATLILKQGTFPLLLMVMLLATAIGCAPTPAPPTPAPSPVPSEIPPTKEQGEIQRIIKVKADGLIFHYWRQSFWGEKEFSNYSANQAQFKTDFKNDFEQGLTHSDVPVSASDYGFSFDAATQSIVARCDIHGALSKRDAGYHATFFWLLKPLDLDFIDNNFEESKRGLSWEGSINGIPTTITIELPTIDDLVYEAWEHPVGHCHAHVWWYE